MVVFAVGCAPASSLADSSSVATTPATNVTSTSAVLHGMASSTTAGAMYYFQYGTSLNYGTDTTPKPIHSSSVENIAASISGLLPGTTYQYRLVVALPYGELDGGGNVTFTTPATPGTVATTGQATNITGVGAELNGVVNSSDPKPQWLFEYGRTRSYGRETPAHMISPGLTLVSAKLTGLRPNTIYHFRLVVQQSLGQTQDGRDGFFKTAQAYGHATVGSHRLKIRHGTASVPFACSGTPGSVCTGTVALKTAKIVHKRLTIIGCGHGKLAMIAGRRHSVAFKLGPRCGSLLRRAPHGQLRARLGVTFTSHQRRLQTTVTLLKT